MVTSVVRGASVFAILALAVLADLYFHPLLSLWLLVLASLTYFRPALGVAILFVVISIDTAKPTIGGVVVNYSEIEFATVLCAWLATVPDLRCLNWKPLLWGAPFLLTVTFSGLINIPWCKVPFHVIRCSELVAAMFLVLNAGLSMDYQGEGRIARQASSGPKELSDSSDQFRWAVFAAAVFYPLVGFLQIDDSVRVFSFFTNPNQFAGYLILLLPFCVVFFLSGSTRRGRYLWFYTSLWVSLALFATLSRTGILSGVVATSVLLVLHFWRMTPRRKFDNQEENSPRESVLTPLLHLVLGCTIVAYLMLGTNLPGVVKSQFQNLKTRSDGGFMTQLQSERLAFMAVGWEVWKDHPLFGVGPGRYKDSLDRYEGLLKEYETKVRFRKAFRRYAPIHAHNLSIQLAADFGVFGLVAFLYLVSCLIRALLRCWKHSLFCVAGLGLMVAFLTHNLLDVTFPSLAFEIGMLWGVSLAAHVSLPCGR